MRKDASSPRGARNRTKGAITGKRSKAKRSRGTDWNRLRQLTADEIHKGIESDPDAHSTDEAFWKSAKVVLPNRKTVVTMRLDTDLLGWFRRQRGYQTRINAILRAYMDAQTN